MAKHKPDKQQRVTPPEDVHTGTFDAERDVIAESIAGPARTSQINANVSGKGEILQRADHEPIPLEASYAKDYSQGSLMPNEPLAEIQPTGMHTGGVSGDTAQTIEDATQGNTVGEGTGGSGGTGGDLTGERTPGGMSEDLTQGVIGGGTYGGPTGGTYTGHGYDSEREIARPGTKTRPETPEAELDRELEKKVIAENTRRLSNERK